MTIGKSLAALLAIGLCVGRAVSAPIHPIGMDALEHPEDLPLLYPPGTQTLQFSSYDLSGGNSDGSFPRAFSKYVDSNGEQVIFDAYGPGSLNRQQINLWQFCRADYSIEYSPGAGESRIRYYFDDEPRPRIDMSVDEFFGGSHAPFDSPFSFTGSFDVPEFKSILESEINEHFNPHGKAFAIQYYPLSFAKRLKITIVPSASLRKYIDFLKNKKFGSSWYQFTYLLYPPDTRIASWSNEGRAGDAARETWRHVGEDPKPATGNTAIHATVAIAPGATTTLLESKGQGSIASLKLRMAPYSEEAFFKLRIRMTWDGMPCVEMPIGVFFGGGAEDYSDRSRVPFKTLANLFYGFDGIRGSFYSYWPMPYWSSAKIEVINDTSQAVTIDADIQQTPRDRLDYPSGTAGYFCAKETKTIDHGDGLFAAVFREQGYGHVVGIGFYSQDYAMDGDEFTYLDGSRTPQIHGDGTEDDHNQGWGGGAFQQPLWGGVISGVQGAYRIYLDDSYVFHDQVKINYEYSRLPAKTNSKTDVIIYYYSAGAGSPRLIQTDALDVGIPESEKAHDYSMEGQTWEGSVRSSYDGYEKNVEAEAFMEDGRAYNGRSAFTIAVDPQNVGVRLRRLLSRSGNGVQTAEVFVDGVKVERPWSVVFNSSAPENQTWVDSDFELPASLTRGKSTLRIEVRHLASTRGELNEFHYWVLSHLPANYYP